MEEKLKRLKEIELCLGEQGYSLLIVYAPIQIIYYILDGY